MDVPNKGQGFALYTQSIEQPDHPRGEWEWPTMTCAHCNTVVYLNPMRAQAGGRERQVCKKCYAYICDHCSPQACTPVKQSIDLGLDIYRIPGQELPTIYHAGVTPQ